MAKYGVGRVLAQKIWLLSPCMCPVGPGPVTSSWLDPGNVALGMCLLLMNAV